MFSEDKIPSSLDVVKLVEIDVQPNKILVRHEIKHPQIFFGTPKTHCEFQKTNQCPQTIHQTLYKCLKSLKKKLSSFQIKNNKSG